MIDNRVYSHYTFDELRELRNTIDREIEKRRRELRDQRFEAMMKAIADFKEVCPNARVSDEYCEDYIATISDIAERDAWDFGP